MPKPWQGPSAQQFAVAIIAACRITGDGPVSVCCRQPARARIIAVLALKEMFPEAPPKRIDALVGFNSPASAHCIMAWRQGWMKRQYIEEVMIAIWAMQIDWERPVVKEARTGGNRWRPPFTPSPERSSLDARSQSLFGTDKPDVKETA